MKIKSMAGIYLVLALVLGAMLPVMFKIASNNINIYEYLMLAYAVALPVSFTYLLARKKMGRLVSTLKNYKELAFIAFLGLLNYGLLEYGLTYAEGYISVSLATVIYRMSPLLMLVFLPIMLREKISKYQIAALMLGFAGLYIAVTAGSLSFLASANALMIGLVVLISLASAFVTVAVKKYSFDMEIGIFIFNLATFIFFTALFLAVRAPLQQVNMKALSAILYVGIIYNVFVGLMYYGAVRMMKTTFVTNIYFLSPFLTFVFSWLVLGQQIYLYYIVIAVLVSAGIIIQKFDRKGGTYAAKKPSETKGQTFYDVTSAFVNTETPLIYNAIKSGGRILAVSMDRDDYEGCKQKVSAKSRANGTVVYASHNRRLTTSSQEEFVRDMMGVGFDDVVVMSAGIPESSERVLTELLQDGPKK